MAQYYHLTIYKTSFDLLVKVSQLVTHFQRAFRYTIGENLTNGMIEFIVWIYKANSATSSRDRADIIKILLERLQFLNILLRLSCELKNISREKFEELTNTTQNMEKQLNGWLSHSSQNCG